MKPLEDYIYAWGWGLGTAGRDDLAVELFLYSIELYPGSPKSLNYFGSYLRNSDRPKEALVQFEKSLQLLEDDEIRTIRNELVEELKREK